MLSIVTLMMLKQNHPLFVTLTESGMTIVYLHFGNGCGCVMTDSLVSLIRTFFIAFQYDGWYFLDELLFLLFVHLSLVFALLAALEPVHVL